MKHFADWYFETGWIFAAILCLAVGAIAPNKWVILTWTLVVGGGSIALAFIHQASS